MHITLRFFEGENRCTTWHVSRQEYEFLKRTKQDMKDQERNKLKKITEDEDQKAKRVKNLTEKTHGRLEKLLEGKEFMGVLLLVAFRRLERKLAKILEYEEAQRAATE